MMSKYPSGKAIIFSMKPSPKDFNENRNPRRGESPAQNMTNPFWTWCIDKGGSGYANNEEFGGPCSLGVGPCWSFNRFGQTKTILPDGRIIHIGGEHEDYYDPDFYIYNDVIIVDQNNKITILGYPEEVFPPTDFHTATLIDDEIILIGSLGYGDKRKEGHTQVLRLNLSDWSITTQETKNGPGWISRHHATLQTSSSTIRISNPQRWTAKHDLVEGFSTWDLNINTWEWTCVEKKNWKQYRLTRKDQSMNNLWEIRNTVEKRNLGISSMDPSSFLDDSLDEESAAEIKETYAEIQSESDKLIADD